ncbi:MAG: glycosyltransferase family 2 protein [Isosphaeraceae bacterium]|nr:glycosyltransferase family 2 protein [Isosphaeraceae bacterium]
MSPEPLVSIVMPCYNATRTLPMALASLLAQTYGHWECLLVDDGSTDRPRELVEQADDPRIRYIGLDRNRGRGVARQVALDHARGELLGMLDADDWFYPSKLADQVEFLRREPGVTLVSTGLAIVARRGELVGVRCCGPAEERSAIRGPFTGLAPPPVAHAPSLIHMSAARRAGYDASLNLSEDIDFLLRVLLGRRYAILPTPAYAYSEHESVTLAKIVGGLRALQRVFRKHRAQFPLSSRANVAWVIAKEGAYRAGFALGLGRTLIERRSRTPTAEEAANFTRSRSVVVGLAARHFGPVDRGGGGAPARSVSGAR